MFYPFAERLKQLLASPLPGWEAHSEMINYPRPRAGELASLVPDARIGSVLVLLYPIDGIWHTVLTLRHTYEGHHSAQVSFPGGKQEPGDTSLWHTALREACEEVGLTPQGITPLGCLSQVYIPPSNFLVNPHVAVAESRPHFVPDPCEVARIIETPLEHLLAPATLRQKPMYLKALANEVSVKYFDIDGETVWGATAMMLNELVHLLKK